VPAAGRARPGRDRDGQHRQDEQRGSAKTSSAVQQQEKDRENPMDAARAGPKYCDRAQAICPGDQDQTLLETARKKAAQFHDREDRRQQVDASTRIDKGPGGESFRALFRFLRPSRAAQDEQASEAAPEQPGGRRDQGGHFNHAATAALRTSGRCKPSRRRRIQRNRNSAPARMPGRPVPTAGTGTAASGAATSMR
jgi:hypothetical protein